MTGFLTSIDGLCDGVCIDELLARHAGQWNEWAEIARAMSAETGGPVIAFDVTQEQRRRMLARGEVPLEETEDWRELMERRRA